VTLTPGRQLEFDEVVESSVGWATAQPAILALALVGSWARHEATMASDIDLVVLTHDMEPYVGHSDWIRDATGRHGRIVRSKAWGPMSERRVELLSGPLVEYGFAPASWASIKPVDEGSATVVADGFRILYDPDGALDRLATAVARQRG
jgi:hypothetical protein